MIYVGWLIWLVGSIISIGWAYTIRTQTRNGSFLMQSTINLNMLFLVSLIAILFLQVTPLHLLWLFPVSIVLSMLSLFRPFSLISIPGKLFGHILCVGIDWEEAAPRHEKNQEPKVQAPEKLKSRRALSQSGDSSRVNAERVLAAYHGMTQEEVRECQELDIDILKLLESQKRIIEIRRTLFSEDLATAKSRADEAADVMGDYGDVLLIEGFVRSESALPHGRETIKDAIRVTLLATSDESLRNHLTNGYQSLACFVPDDEYERFRHFQEALANDEFEASEAAIEAAIETMHKVTKRMTVFQQELDRWLEDNQSKLEEAEIAHTAVTGDTSEVPDKLTDLIKRAYQGNADAQNDLGYLYGIGVSRWGVPLDLKEAVRWWRAAAEQGYAGAQNQLGMAYNYGKGVPQDNKEAARWYRAAAEQGLAEGQYNLGACYDRGKGVPLDFKKTARWYRAAANQGNADAQFNLGLMYRKGEGVPLDIREAARWWRAAAEQGDAGAQFNLGLMHGKGEGVPLDIREAVRWWRAAAEQGDAGAQNGLGMAYRTGMSLPQDYIQAQMWFNLAASSLTGEKRATAAKNRDEIAEEMTSEQIAEAQRLAREWKPKSPGSQ